MLSQARVDQVLLLLKIAIAFLPIVTRITKYQSKQANLMLYGIISQKDTQTQTQQLIFYINLILNLFYQLYLFLLLNLFILYLFIYLNSNKSGSNTFFYY